MLLLSSQIMLNTPLLWLTISLVQVSSLRFNIYHPNHEALQKASNRINVAKQEIAYRLKAYVGTDPTMEAYLVFDTGSNLVWLQSSLCINCSPSMNELIQYNMSSVDLSFVDCSNLECGRNVPGKNCKANVCRFNKYYFDGSSTRGLIGIDSFAFDAGNNDMTPKKKLIFGIGMANSCAANGFGCLGGVAGSNLNPFSLPNQLQAQKWAFYLPQDDQSVGCLLFDDDVNISPGAYKAPLVGIDHYETILSKVCVSEECATPSRDATIFLDTGASGTHLMGTIYDDVMAKVEDHIYKSVKIRPVQTPANHTSDGVPKLCYQNIKPMVMIDIYVGNSKFESDIDALWKQSAGGNNRYCLTIFKQPFANILGSNFMRGYLISVELTEKAVPKLIIPKSRSTPDDACLEDF